MNLHKPTPANTVDLPRSPTLVVDRLLIFGGPYSNLAATRAMLKEASRLGFAADQILCTGDVVAYCGEPAETLDLIQQSGIQVIMGNCEESLSSGNEDCGCGFEEGSHCELLSVQWYDFAARKINQDHRTWMAALPRQVHVEIGTRTLLATHASYTSINEFIFASTPAEKKLSQMIAADVDGMITGHSGLPFAQILSDRLWLNAGAIGQPANDGTRRVWFAILQSQHGKIDVEIKSLDYDPATTIKAMSDRGLMSGYQECLSTGLWPSMDVLPTPERNHSGLALEQKQHDWAHPK